MISQTQQAPLIERLRRYYGCGLYAGKIFCMVITLDYLFWIFLEIMLPSHAIERTETFPYKQYRDCFNNNRTFLLQEPKEGEGQEEIETIEEEALTRGNGR